MLIFLERRHGQRYESTVNYGLCLISWLESQGLGRNTVGKLTTKINLSEWHTDFVPLVNVHLRVTSAEEDFNQVNMLSPSVDIDQLCSLVTPVTDQ